MNLHHQRQKRQDGPTFPTNLILQLPVLVRDPVFVVVVSVVTAVILDQVPRSPGNARRAEKDQDECPPEPGDQVNRDDGARVNPPVAAAGADADDFGDVPDEGYDHLRRGSVC